MISFIEALVIFFLYRKLVKLRIFWVEKSRTRNSRINTTPSRQQFTWNSKWHHSLSQICVYVFDTNATFYIPLISSFCWQTYCHVLFIYISRSSSSPCLAFRVIFFLNLFTFICRWQNRISNERQLLWCVSPHFFLRSTLETISNRTRRHFYIYFYFIWNIVKVGMHCITVRKRSGSRMKQKWFCACNNVISLFCVCQRIYTFWRSQFIFILYRKTISSSRTFFFVSKAIALQHT